MKRSHQLKGVMHWEMFQNNQSDVWAKKHWQDGGSKIDLPIEMDDQHRYATSGPPEELERQNLVLRFRLTKNSKSFMLKTPSSPDLIRMFLNIFDSMNVNTPRDNGLRTPLPNQWSQETYDGTGRYGSTYQITERHNGKTELGQNQECLYRGVTSAPRRNQLLVKLRRSTANPRPATKMGVAARTKSW